MEIRMSKEKSKYDIETFNILDNVGEHQIMNRWNSNSYMKFYNKYIDQIREKTGNHLGNNSSQTYICLFILTTSSWLGYKINKRQITEIYQKITNRSTNDLQAPRHLKNHGWNIYNKNGVYCLNGSLHIVSKSKYSREDKLSNKDFLEIKAKYNNCCATCRQKENSKDKRNRGVAEIRLEKGHIDKRKPLDKDNCIPQCQYCNKTALDKKVFYKNGKTCIILDNNDEFIRVKDIELYLTKDFNDILMELMKINEN